MDRDLRKLPRTLGRRFAPQVVKDRVHELEAQWEQRAEHRQREELMRAFCAQFVDPGHLCFDVGANKGTWTSVFRGLDARVVAVEPQEALARALARRHVLDRRVHVVRAAAGSQPGEAEIMLADADTVSSLASDWVAAVRASGRFGDMTWQGRERVTVVTLDQLVARYGLPRFIKIDVEGYEPEVLAGLSAPVPYLSFAFTPEFGAAADQCIDRLCELGMTVFNFAVGESLELASAEWYDAHALRRALARVTAASPLWFGDVYAAASRCA